jgi:tetratricopeptide (TPR) repeat protein
LAAAALGVLGAGAWFALRPLPPPLAGLRTGPDRPLRILLVAADHRKASDSWIGAALRETLTNALRGRRDLLIYGPPLTGSSSQGPTDAGAVKELAARHGADLVLLMSFRSEGDHHRLRLETLRTGERLAHPLLDKSFDTQDYLAVEAELHRLLPARLGLSGPARPWTGPRFLETRRTTVQASQLVTAELNSEGLGAALALLRKITAQEPDYALPHALLGVVLASEANEASHRGDTAKATADLAEGTREALTAVRLGPADPEGYNALCLNLRVAGDPGGTERAARQYLAIEPLAIRPHLYLARIEAARPTAEAFQSAVAHLRSAVLLGPEDPEASYRLGQIHLDAGQWALALPALDQAINAMPQMEFAHVVKSNALIWSGRTQEAEASLKAAQRWVPNSILIKRNLAYTAYLLGDLSAFTERLARCRELWPKGNATREFLDGLEEASRGHWRQAQARYGAQLRHFRDHQATLSQSLGTSISVDLYLMGRVLAQGPDRAAAKPYVQLADHYAPNRLRMARRDPAFKGLWPEPEPWPGD